MTGLTVTSKVTSTTGARTLEQKPADQTAKTKSQLSNIIFEFKLKEQPIKLLFFYLCSMPDVDRRHAVPTVKMRLKTDLLI